MVKYLEVDSSHRDRTKFPNTGQFEVIISQTGTQNEALKAVDPISLSTPLVTYTSDDIDAITTTSVQSSETNTSNSFIVCFPIAQSANQTSNYYRGIQVQLMDGVLDLGRITIQTWDYLNTVAAEDCFRVTFTPAITPSLISTIDSFTLVSSTDFSLGLVFIPNGVISSQVYKNWFVYNENLNESTPILSYDGNNSLASIAPQAGWLTSHVINIRRELPCETGAMQAGSTANTVVLAAVSNPLDDFYNGAFLRITGGTSANIGQIRQITDYVGTTTTAILNAVLPAVPVATDTYEILPFTRDNFVPFSYTGLPFNQATCYEIQLVNLILPNITLESGGQPGSYPFFYVELQNISNSGGQTNDIIYSNNPHATRRLFRVPVTDISSTLLDSFITLERSYMAQTVKINPYSSFKFGIYLPDGTNFQTAIVDTTSPSPPNPNIQISAIFSLRRVSV